MKQNSMSKVDKTTEIFRNAPIPKAVLFNIIPSVVSMLMVMVYNLADTFFIGQTKNPYMVAAVSLATPAFLIFMAIGLIFGVGGTSYISRMLGEGKSEKAKNASSFCFWTGLGVGVIAVIFVYLCINPICKLIGTSADTVEYTKQYMMIVALSIPFVIVGNSFSNIIRSEGKANIAMTGMILGNITNMVLDPIMILGFDWDVVGAAVATVIGNMVAFVFYLIHLTSKRTILSIRPKDYKASEKIAMGILSIGIPASVNNMLMSTSNIVINNLLKGHDDMAVAGLGVAFKVNMLVVMLLIGVGTGIQPLLGYCFGAGNRKRFVGVLKFSVVLAICMSAVLTVICYLGAAPMVRAFLDNDAAFEFAFSFARTLIISGPILGVLFVFINTIQAMGVAVPTLILSLSRQGIIYLPTLFMFHHFFNTPKMLVMAQPVADYLSTLLAIILFVITFKRIKMLK